MVSYFRDRDIGGLLRRVGVDVTFGATTVKGVRDETDSAAAEGTAIGIIEGLVVVQIETGSLPGLAIGSAITVEAVPYVVRDKRRVGDGALTALWCEA